MPITDGNWTMVDRTDRNEGFAVRAKGSLIAQNMAQDDARAVANLPKLLDATENLIIAIGMGWDRDGVIQAACEAVAKVRGEPAPAPFSEEATLPVAPELTIFAAIAAELARARAKFPAPNLNLAALGEECGELAEALLINLSIMQAHQGRLARAMLHTRFGGDAAGWEHVRKEAIQVAVMAIRVALEGDATIAQPPADSAAPSITRGEG